jgi:hypothetical protein
LLANQESRPEVQKKLNSLLITPVQRIPRYKEKRKIFQGA